jgi:hypothetical protein
MSSFPATITEDIEASSVQEYAVSVTSGETAAASGELMYFDTSTQTLKRCGADPSLIAGIAEGASATWRLLTPNNKIPLRTLSPRCGVRMCSSTTLSEANVGVAYGIVRDANGFWAVDTTDTSNTRVFVYRVDTGANAAFVRFVAANLQFDAIAS